MQPWQWWADFIVKFAAAVFTLCAVVVALFGAKLRASWVPLKWKLSLISSEGDKHPYESTEAFWYFARLENNTRWNPVDSASIFIISVKYPDAGRTFRFHWKGEMPLLWRHQRDLLPRKIGPKAECDICCVMKSVPAVGGPVVRFHTHFPTSGLETTFSKPFEMRLALQGKGIEADT